MRQLKTLLNLYNLFSTVTFRTGIGKEYISAIDNMFIDSPKFKNYKIFPLNNGLSDHDVHSVEQKSMGLKFSKSRTGSHVTYSCHHNSSLLFSPYLRIRGISLSSIHYNQSHCIYIN